MGTPYDISDTFCSFLAGVEGCVLHEYHGSADAPGIITIYFGHVVRPGDVFTHTMDDAKKYLKQDTGTAKAWLYRHCPWTTSQEDNPGRQHNFDACVSMVYNAGHLFDGVLALVNGPQPPPDLAKVWISYSKANSVPGVLTLRRTKEAALYLTPDVPPDADQGAVQAAINAQALEFGRFVLLSDSDLSPDSE